MSRKKSKQRQAVPEEILAEGSGPVGEAAEVRAEEPAEPVKPAKKAKKAKARKQAAEPETAKDEEVAGEADADVLASEDTPQGEDDGDADGDAELTAADEGDEAPAEMTAAGEGDEEPAQMIGEGDEMSRADSGEMAAESAAIEAAEAAPPDDEELAAMSAAEGDELAAMSASAGDLDAIAPNGDDVVGDPITDEATVEAALLPGTLSPVQLRHLIEALIFATDKPVTLQRLRQLTRVSDVTRIEQALAELHEDYKDRGIALHQVSGGYQFRTNTAFSTWVQQLIQGRPVRLSRAQLETLAIVAYRQPITRPEIDEIRGVDSSATLRLLLDRSLIRVLGRREEVGRPTLYGTTKEFLDFFSLSDLRELPTLREYSELTAESRQVMSDRLGVSLDANGEPIEGEGDELLGESELGDEGPSDQASIVDSILAEHAAAEAEAEARIDARHDVGADLAEAAMAGGSTTAFRDILSDEPDPDAMMMSGEMSPAGSEARSYVDAIRAGALESESEPDEAVLPHLEVSDAVAAQALEAEHVSDDLATASSDAAATSDAVELASEELLAASEDLAAVVADEVAEAHEPHHVAPTPADDMELRADEPADQPHIEPATADNIELRADEPIDQPHIEAAVCDEIELRADEPAEQPDVGLTADADDDIELRADEPADEAGHESHVGLTPDDDRGGDESVDESVDSDDPDSAN